MVQMPSSPANAATRSPVVGSWRGTGDEEAPVISVFSTQSPPAGRVNAVSESKSATSAFSSPVSGSTISDASPTRGESRDDAHDPPTSVAK